MSPSNAADVLLYRYAALRRRDLAGAVYDLFVQLCPVVLPVTLADTDRARQPVVDLPDASVRDAIHAAVIRRVRRHQTTRTHLMLGRGG